MNDIITVFTYSDLSAPVAAEVEAATTRIKNRLTRQVKDIIETGRDLIEVKGKLRHGQFARHRRTHICAQAGTRRPVHAFREWAEGRHGR